VRGAISEVYSILDSGF